MGSNGVICRPSGGWNGKTFYPLIPPRSSRPSTKGSDYEAPLPLHSESNIPDNSISLLNGSYDEEAAAREFQAAVMQFRSADSNQLDATAGSQTPPENKIKAVTALFSGSGPNPNVELEKKAILRELHGDINVNSYPESPTNEKVTEEELEIEEERELFRQMLGIETKTPTQSVAAIDNSTDETFLVPNEWRDQKSQPISFKKLNIAMKDGIDGTRDMWLPHTNLQFDQGMTELI